MPFLLRNIRLDLAAPLDDLPGAAARRLRLPVEAIRAYAIVRRSIDARDKDDVHYRYHLEIALRDASASERRAMRRLRANEATWIDPPRPAAVEAGTAPLLQRPIVVGFGPAGMFAALKLAELGYRPLVIERGREVRRRHRDVVQRYYRRHDFDPESNLLYGEGGAGTYSDGKLYTRISEPRVPEILQVFYQHGADPDILIDARPHVGSDRLPTICTRIRRHLESLGGEVRFGARLDDVEIVGGAVTSVTLSGERMAAGPVLLAVGHSARDTILMLARRRVRIEPKPFQIGVRIEHPQAMVDAWQFGGLAGHPGLGPAEYHLIAKGACQSGDLFTFCMCPGGQILPANESPGLIATNGASRASRGGAFANAGLVITVDPAALARSSGFPPVRASGAGLRPDSGGRLHPDGGAAAAVRQSDLDGLPEPAAVALRALFYQKHWEEAAYVSTNGTYCVPAQRASDFLAGRMSDGACETSFPLGARWRPIREVIPASVAAALERGLPMLERRMPGFSGPAGVITAPETRASSPIRITRDAVTRASVSADNLYPVGEGAGFAGGIISAAVDGLKSAEAIVRKYAPPARGAAS
ncbi:MAG: FAD-dependent oxidoreductase [Phycisphaerales bacterium]|nr:MAG: FAD-dependent oxidoreductase [Phycisphaerales bacterium]